MHGVAPFLTMNHITSNLKYLGKPPWDSGISPPELLEFIAQHPAGRAIDLGCGTGTNSIALAQSGWEVIGVDVALIALHKARKKAKAAGVQVRFKLSDASQLSGIEGRFDFALDMGCFHNLGERKANYLARLDDILAPRGYWLLYAHLYPPDGRPANHGVSPADLETAAERFSLLWHKTAPARKGRRSVWALFQKRG